MLDTDVLKSLNYEQSISFLQDLIHVATKLRNRLLKISILLPMGISQVSVKHLKLLVNYVEKEVHGLVFSARKTGKILIPFKKSQAIEC